MEGTLEPGSVADPPATAHAEPTATAQDESTAPEGATPPAGSGRGRFVVCAAAGQALVTLPFLWVLWDLWTGKVDPLRAVSPSNFYDLQGRAMLGGHFDLPPGSIGIEAFLHAGRTYTYFGLFPSLLRLPVLAVTHAYDGRLTAPSILAAWLVACVSACLLYWRVRVVVRGAAPMGWAEAVAAGASLAALTGGSFFIGAASASKRSHFVARRSLVRALHESSLAKVVSVAVERRSPNE